MRPRIAADVAWSVCLSVRALDALIVPAKAAEPIEMPFGLLWTRVGATNHVLDGMRARFRQGNRQLLLLILNIINRKDSPYSIAFCRA